MAGYPNNPNSFFKVVDGALLLKEVNCIPDFDPSNTDLKQDEVLLYCKSGDSGKSYLYCLDKDGVESRIFNELDDLPSSNYTFVSGEIDLNQSQNLVEASGSFQITLPTASGNSGKEFIIKNSYTGVIVVSGNSNQKIDNLDSINLTERQSVNLRSNGLGWFIT